MATHGPAVEAASLAVYAAAIDKARAMLAHFLTYAPAPKDTFNWLAVALVALTLPAVTWAAVRAYRYRPGAGRALDAVAVPDAPAARLGGWLLLVGFGIVTAPFQLLAAMRDGLKTIASTVAWRALTTPGTSAYHPGLATLVTLECLVNFAFAAYWTAIVVLFFRRKSTFPFHYRVALLSFFGFLIVDLVCAASLSESTHAQSHLPNIVRTGITCLIWVPYMGRSRRVARTFVNA